MQVGVNAIHIKKGTDLEGHPLSHDLVNLDRITRTSGTNFWVKVPKRRPVGIEIKNSEGRVVISPRTFSGIAQSGRPEIAIYWMSPEQE